VSKYDLIITVHMPPGPVCLGCGTWHDTEPCSVLDVDVARDKSLLSMFLLTAPSRFENADERLEGFIAHARRNAVRSLARNRTGSKLVHEFKQNFILVTAAVKAHRCLKLDFQVYLRSDGGVINVDLDRCFGHNQSAGEVSLSNSIELPEPRHKDHAPGEAPEALCRRGSEQRRFDKALKQFYEKLKSAVL